MNEKQGFGDYYDYLKNEIMSYRGNLPEYVYYVPSLFRTLTGVLDAEQLDAQDRIAVFCALGYFVAPNDVIPEEVYGPLGYVDDIYLCAWVLDRLVRKYGAPFVSPFWEREEDPIEEFLPYVLEETAKDLKEKTTEILSYTGLGERFS
jgi:uncharacterized membrane protein YkvA (DUF1232 family)